MHGDFDVTCSPQPHHQCPSPPAPPSPPRPTSTLSLPLQGSPALLPITCLPLGQTNSLEIR